MKRLVFIAALLSLTLPAISADVQATTTIRSDAIPGHADYHHFIISATEPQWQNGIVATEPIYVGGASVVRIQLASESLTAVGEAITSITATVGISNYVSATTEEMVTVVPRLIGNDGETLPSITAATDAVIRDYALVEIETNSSQYLSVFLHCAEPMDLTPEVIITQQR